MERVVTRDVPDIFAVHRSLPSRRAAQRWHRAARRLCPVRAASRHLHSPRLYQDGELLSAPDTCLRPVPAPRPQFPDGRANGRRDDQQDGCPLGRGPKVNGPHHLQTPGLPAAKAGSSEHGRTATDGPRTQTSRRWLLALDPSQPVRGRPPLDDEHRGLLVEVGVHDLGDVGEEAVAVRSFGDRLRQRSPGRRSSPRPATAPRSPRPGRPWRCAGRTADPGGDPRPCARSASSRRPARRPRRPSRSRRSAATRRLARWRLSCAGARRTAPARAARTPALPVRLPATPSRTMIAPLPGR